MEADDLDEGNNEEALVDEENRDDSDSDEGPNNIQAGAESLLSTAQAKFLPTVPIMEEGKRARRSIAEHGATGGAAALGGIVGREMGKNFAKRQHSSDKSRSAREGKESYSMLGRRQSASLERDSPILPLSSTNTTLRKNGWVDASSDLSSRSYDRATQHSRIHSSNASSSGLVVAIQKSQKPEKHRFNRISTMQTQKSRRMLSRRSSTRFQLNVFPKDSFVPSRNNLKLPPFWTRKDTYIIIAFTIFILGAVFMLAALSWQYRDSNDSSVVAALTAFGEDILFRTFIIITVEAVLLLPCCCQSGGGQVLGPSAVAPREDSRSFYLQPDVNYFRYDKAAVLVTVTPQGEIIGLRRGWKVKSINGDSVSNGTECFAKLRAATKIAGPFEIEFDTSGSRENWVSSPILPEGHLAANDRGKKQEEMSSLSCTSSNLSFFSNLKDQDPRLFLPPGRNASREPSRPSTAMFFGSRSRPSKSIASQSAHDALKSPKMHSRRFLTSCHFKVLL
uniref:Uncharacterized protein n=1 Tax=Bigelowiella natans TaxID=227086 RepID=A0A7S2P5K3_BIGNA